MASIVQAASRRTGFHGDVFAGLLLATGAVALFVGTLFYARLTVRLGLPASPADRPDALADVLSLGAERLSLAGGFAFLGDCLLLAAAIAMAARRRRKSDLEAVGWALIAVSLALALIFDSMTAALFWPLARSESPGPFLAFKTWFDFLFAAADVPFGMGVLAVLSVETRAEAPILPKPLLYLGALVAVAAALSGFASATSLLNAPLVIGLSVSFGCLILIALGVRIARGEPAGAMGNRI